VTPTVVALTLLAGALGAVLRGWVQHTAGARGHARRGTLAVNLAGTALLGLVVGADAPTAVLAVVGAGLCGGLTTFSTWMVQTVTAEPGSTPPPRPGPVLRRVGGAVGVLGVGVAVGVAALAVGAAT
jgi:fluoride exporter